MSRSRSQNIPVFVIQWSVPGHTSSMNYQWGMELTVATNGHFLLTQYGVFLSDHVCKNDSL